MTATDVLLIAAGYLAGSLPTGLLAGRLRGIDLREHGSGNIGATNAGRVLGRPWFFVVFALDFAKSFLPALLVKRYWSGATPAALSSEDFALVVGVAAVIGHVFPVFLRFRGGKGVASAAGVFAALAPIPAAVAFLAWLVAAKGSGYVSVGSLVAAVVLPAACWLLPAASARIGTDEGARWRALVETGEGVRWAALLVGALIVLRHRANIGRLLRGTEPRTSGPRS